MDTRRRMGMRRLVDTTLEQLRSGALQPASAARTLHEAGVPFKVIGRVAELARARPANEDCLGADIPQSSR